MSKTKNNKRSSSSTPGKLKSEACKKSDLKIRLAKDPRFYKTDPLNYLKAIDEVNKFHSLKS